MKKIIISLFAIVSLVSLFAFGSQNKVSAATYHLDKYICKLPGADCGQHDPLN